MLLRSLCILLAFFVLLSLSSAQGYEAWAAGGPIEILEATHPVANVNNKC